MADLTTLAARLALAGKYATQYALDPALVCAVIEQESGWNSWAVRLEMGFLARYVKPVNPASPTTEEITKAMSFGLMQVMGLVAREAGFTGRFLTELCDPDTGVSVGCKVLKGKIDRANGDVHQGLQNWNGGGNPQYADQVLARVATYQQVAPDIDGEISV